MKPITDAFVTVALDCPVATAVVPVARGGAAALPPVHVLQYELLTARPYALTLEDLIFETHVRRSGLSPADAAARAAQIRAELFRKPHACMRASALPKRYGWGVHYDAAGRIALHAVESAAYRRFAAGGVPGVAVAPAMRTKRAGKTG